jgi:hypothetical protein
MCVEVCSPLTLSRVADMLFLRRTACVSSRPATKTRLTACAVTDGDDRGDSPGSEEAPNQDHGLEGTGRLMGRK